MLAWLKNLMSPRSKDHGMSELVAVMQREASLREKGWVPFINPPRGSPSPVGRTVEIIDREGLIIVAPYDDIPALCNVAGKFWREYSPQWRPEEIAKFRAEAAPPIVPNRLMNLADATKKDTP